MSDNIYYGSLAYYLMRVIISTYIILHYFSVYYCVIIWNMRVIIIISQFNCGIMAGDIDNNLDLVGLGVIFKSGVIPCRAEYP